MKLPGIVSTVFGGISSYVDKIYLYMKMGSSVAGFDFERLIFMLFIILIGILILKWRLTGMLRIAGYAIVLIGIVFGLYALGIIS